MQFESYCCCLRNRFTLMNNMVNDVTVYCKANDINSVRNRINKFITNNPKCFKYHTVVNCGPANNFVAVLKSECLNYGMISCARCRLFNQ